MKAVVLAAKVLVFTAMLTGCVAAGIWISSGGIEHFTP